jgi:hypothetical protein
MTTCCPADQGRLADTLKHPDMTSNSQQLWGMRWAGCCGERTQGGVAESLRMGQVKEAEAKAGVLRRQLGCCQTSTSSSQGADEGCTFVYAV